MSPSMETWQSLILGTAPGNSIAPLAGEELEGALVEVFAGGVDGIRPAACASAADNSPEFMRTSLSPSPGTLGCASRFTFSWRDCALAAAAAGASAGVTGAGRFNTRTRVRIEFARVAKLMMRCSFTKTPPPFVSYFVAFYGTRGKRLV